MAHSIKLGGLDITFPYQPYGIQKAMLAKMAVTLTNKEHSLIESPTGTGKTLVLLCSALAWRQRSKLDQSPFISTRFKTRLQEERLRKLRAKQCTCGRRPNQSADELMSNKKCGDDDDLKKPVLKKAKLEEDDVKISFQKPKIKTTKSKEPEYITIGSSDDENDPDATQVIKEYTKSEVIDMEEEDKNNACKPFTDSSKAKTCSDKISEELCRSCEAIKIEDDYKDELNHVRYNLNRVPKIYYGTRTHKQIAQVVRELKKTCYTKDLRMNILSSRDRTCIHEDVRDMPDRNDRCQELIKNKPKNSNGKPIGESCAFYRDSNQMAVEFSSIYERFEAFDIEDAVTFGNENRICPYYGVRSLQEEADITFCPYNYLLDSNIRSALQINLKNAVIILDEAHNIEDICRDSASFEIDTQQLDELLNDINRVAQNFIQGSTIRDSYDFFRNLFTDLKAFLLKYNFGFDNQQDGDILAKKTMKSDEMLATLELMNFSSQNLTQIKDNLKTLRGDTDEDSEKNKSQDTQDEAKLGNNDLQLITLLANTLEFIHSSNGKYKEDYRCIVYKKLERAKPTQRNSNRVTNGDIYIYQLSLLCMNPGIAFQKIHESCWSVIVASGTLSPIESLKTELGCEFSQIFEGSHVIPEERIFASILSVGPNKVELNCSYASSLKLDFQDELGHVVRDVCKHVPNGILVFFPSYDRMENLYQRWFTKGFIKEVQSEGRKVFREQRSYTAAKFEEELKKYFRSAQSRGGALMFAVYRGKISEGVDFSDAAARAVISVGIPYANLKDVRIGLKRDYNDEVRRARPELMTGGDWYATQAFRSLNQALGRCIRHKNDWGSVILVDSRLKANHNFNNISKWVRRCVKKHDNYQHFQHELKEFLRTRQDED